MTFGEHLEELRTSLFKALIGLVLGTLFGLTIGNHVVLWMERPLTKALGDFYTTDAEEQYALLVAEMEAAGKTPPYTMEQVQALVHDRGLLFDIRYVHPNETLAELRGKPEPETDVAGVLHESLVPVLFFHQITDDTRVRIKSFSAPEAFSIWLKASLVVGVILSSPWVFYHIWAFVAAGLYPHEKRYVHIFLPFSLGLFFLGAATAYFFVFGPVLDFLFGFNRWLGLDPDPRITEWLSFVLMLPLGFGLSFQLPLVMLFLERIGVFRVTDYWQKWRIAVLVIFILSAILTPADPYSLLLMAVPVTVLYFFGILLCSYLPKRTYLAEE